MEISGGRTKVSGSTMMMPVEIVMPGIMPTTKPNRHPTAVAARVVARLAWVSWHENDSKWLARIGIGGGKQKHLGRFDDEAAAAQAYTAAAAALDRGRLKEHIEREAQKRAKVLIS